MSVTESIWAMVNLTLSALAVIWLTASYAKVAFQKTNKRANLLLLGYAAFLTICFFAVSYGMYGDVKYLILEKTRSLYSLLFWTAILFYYIFAYRKQPLFKRRVQSIICGVGATGIPFWGIFPRRLFISRFYSSFGNFFKKGGCISLLKAQSKI